MKKETTIEQTLKDTAEQAGVKPEDVKTITIKQVAGIHTFSVNMDKPPIVLVDGDFADVMAILGFTISEIIDSAVKTGMQRARVEQTIVKTTQLAIATSRKEAFRKAVQEGEKH